MKSLLVGAVLIAALSFTGALAQTTPATPAATATAPAQPDCSAQEYRSFDFWVGEWDAYEAADPHTRAGRSSITREDGGCVIAEHWIDAETPNYSGRSLNIYDRASGHWEQVWVDSTGEITHFVGGLFEGGMQLTDPSNHVAGRADPVQTRMTFTPLPDGSVRQRGQVSIDNGATWRERYDYIYRRHVGT